MLRTTVLVSSILLFQASFLLDASIPTTQVKCNSKNNSENVISIKETLGFVVMNASSKKGASVYNKDGSVWKQISFNDQILSPSAKEFAPYAFQKDYFLLVFRCKAKIGSLYEVIVNEQTKQTKYIKVSDTSYKFQNWEQHLVSICCVGFDNKNNPIKANPDITSKVVSYNQDELYIPKSVKGDWLQVAWGNGKNQKTGWIRWKSKDKLIIELFYFA